MAVQSNTMWRVRAVNAAGAGDYIELVRFSIIEELQKPIAPEPVSPSAGSTVVAGEPITMSLRKCQKQIATKRAYTTRPKMRGHISTTAQSPDRVIQVHAHWNLRGWPCCKAIRCGACEPSI